MKKSLSSTLLALAIISPLAIGTTHAKDLKNLDLIKEQYVKYYHSGDYLHDQTKVVDQAMLYLKNRLASDKAAHNHKKLAMVLDIDETSLSNYPDMEKMGFGGSEEEVCDAEGKATDPAITPTLELYRYAKANHVAVFFITGRFENFRDATIKNLQDVGYKNYDGLILKPLSYHENSPTPYKTAARQNIEAQGYDIILNMGDQESDLAGKHADKTFKLPNPYYFIP